MFSSEAYGQKNLLFKDATSELVPIATQTYEAWLGREYLHAMKGLLCDPNRKSTFLFSCWPQPDYGCGQACWRGGHRRNPVQRLSGTAEQTLPSGCGFESPPHHLQPVWGTREK